MLKRLKNSDPTNKESISYRCVDDDPDYGVFDERNNSFLAIRNVSWNEREPKLEIRKYFINSDGEETPNKGVIFLTDEGPHTLAEKLVESGFGNTEKLKQYLDTRVDEEEEEIEEVEDDAEVEDDEEEEEEVKPVKKVKKESGFNVSKLMQNINSRA